MRMAVGLDIKRVIQMNDNCISRQVEPQESEDKE